MKNLPLILLLLLLNVAVAPKLFSQNVSINSDGSLADTSAMLDVSSTDKGFLLPRMTTAQQDAIILPATGLTIFNTITNSIMINTGTPLSPAWAPLSVQGVIDTSVITNFYSKVRSLFSATGPITYANGLIGITQATTATDGYLSSADWNTFNSKVGSIPSGDLGEINSSVLTISGGTGAVLGAGTTVEVKQANALQDGFLSASDWSAFNSKLTTIDTTDISDFSGKVRSLFSSTDPITYVDGTVGITQATTATDGYLSSTDWNTFNNKGSGTVTDIETGYGLSGGPITTTGTIIVDSAALSLQYLRIADTANIRVRPVAGGNMIITGTYPDLTFTVNALGTGSVSSIATTAPITGGTITTTGTIGITQATGSTDGYLSSADWNTFNNKGSGSVTDIETGYGLTGGPITTTGTVTVDSAALSLHYLRIADTADIRFRPVAGSNITITGTYPDLTFNASDETGTVSSITTTSPITGGTITTTGTIGITQASGSTDGYLTSADWNTFNSKAGPITSGDLSETGSDVLTITGGTGAVLGSGTSLEVKQATTDVDGYLSAADWNIFNDKVDNIILNGDGVIYSGSSWGVNTGTATGSLTLNQQSKNKVLAGPTSGTNAPTFRLLAPSDLPLAIYPSFSYVAKTSTYTAAATDYTIDCTSGTFTVTLPTAAGIQGRVYVVKNSGTGAITVGTTASQTIDGSTTKLLNVQYSQVTVQSTGTNWIILSN